MLCPKGTSKAAQRTARALWLSPLRGDKEVGVSSSPTKWDAIYPQRALAVFGDALRAYIA